MRKLGMHRVEELSGETQETKRVEVPDAKVVIMIIRSDDVNHETVDRIAKSLAPKFANPLVVFGVGLTDSVEFYVED